MTKLEYDAYKEYLKNNGSSIDFLDELFTASAYATKIQENITKELEDKKAADKEMKKFYEKNYYAAKHILINKPEEGAEVKYSIVMPGTVIKKGAVVQYSIVAENAVIEEGAIVGASPENMENIDDWGVAVVGNGVKIGKGAKAAPNVMIDSDVGGAE